MKIFVVNLIIFIIYFNCCKITPLLEKRAKNKGFKKIGSTKKVEGVKIGEERAYKRGNIVRGSRYINRMM